MLRKLTCPCEFLRRRRRRGGFRRDAAVQDRAHAGNRGLRRAGTGVEMGAGDVNTCP